MQLLIFYNQAMHRSRRKALTVFSCCNALSLIIATSQYMKLAIKYCAFLLKCIIYYAICFDCAFKSSLLFFPPIFFLGKILNNLIFSG